MSYNLIVNLHFWNKDSNSLFDYEADEYIKSTLKVKKAGVVLRKDKQLHFMDKNKLWENGISSYVAKCEKKNDLFEMDFYEDNDKYLPKTIEEKPWIIIRHTSFSNKNGFRLKIGNIVRLGKSIFKITDLKSKDKKLKKEKFTITDLNRDDHQVADYTDNNVYPVNEFGSNNVDFIQINRYDNKKEKYEKILTSENRNKNPPICRVCWSSDHLQDNPLLRPCYCSGSVKYIHLFCLQQTLKSKIITKSFNYHSIYAYKILECELCKKPLTDKLNLKNQIINLLDLNKPESNYIILESLAKEKNETKYIYVINMNEKSTIKIGRSNESDLRMSDISISRNHAIIRLLGGNFYLEDNCSKFGSLVQTTSKVVVLPYKQIALQIGRYFYVFNLKKNLFACLTCYKPKNIIYDYNQYFETVSNTNSTDNSVLEKVSKYESDFSNFSQDNSNIKEKSQEHVLTNNEGIEEYEASSFMRDRFKTETKEVKNIVNKVFNNFKNEEKKTNIVPQIIENN